MIKIIKSSNPGLKLKQLVDLLRENDLKLNAVARKFEEIIDEKVNGRKDE